MAQKGRQDEDQNRQLAPPNLGAARGVGHCFPVSDRAAARRDPPPHGSTAPGTASFQGRIKDSESRSPSLVASAVNELPM